MKSELIISNLQPSSPAGSRPRAGFRAKASGPGALASRRAEKRPVTISQLFVPIFKMQREFPMYSVCLSSEKVISLVRDCILSPLYSFSQQWASDHPELTDQTARVLGCCHQKGQKMASSAREDKCPTTTSSGFQADTCFIDRVGHSLKKPVRTKLAVSHNLAPIPSWPG